MITQGASWNTSYSSYYSRRTTILSKRYLNSSVISRKDISWSPEMEFMRMRPKLPVCLDSAYIFSMISPISTSNMPFSQILVVRLLCRSGVRQ